jgi:hypothetical protein
MDISCHRFSVDTMVTFKLMYKIKHFFSINCLVFQQISSRAISYGLRVKLDCGKTCVRGIPR